MLCGITLICPSNERQSAWHSLGIEHVLTVIAWWKCVRILTVFSLDSSMDAYFIRRGEKVVGPVTLAQVMANFRANQLAATDTIADSQLGPWEPVGDFCGRQTALDQQDPTDASHQVTPQVVAASVVDSESNPFAAPPVSTDSVTPSPSAEGDTTGGIIPYKNPHALIAYYLGIVSGLPMIGLPFGIAAFILGLKGLRARKENPVIKGSVHAAIGIGCGGLFSLLWTVLGFALLALWYMARTDSLP